MRNIYGPENAVFTCMMYSSQAPLKPGEEHCPYCNGYAIKPVLRERGQKTQYHQACGCGTGKIKSYRK